MKVHRALESRMGRNFLMASISIEPEFDTPSVLREYAEMHRAILPGWYFLTGEYDEIEQLRHRLGVYDLDPVVDADKTSHSGLITFGNDRTDRWAALPALMDVRGLVRTILRITRPMPAAEPG